MDSSTSSNSSLVSSKSDAVFIQAPPKDSFNYSYWVFVVLGIVLILPWNALIQSLGFLDSKYPGKDINFMVSTVANAPIFIAQILMLIFYRYVKLKTFILLSLVFMSLLCVAIPLVSNYWNEYIVIMVILTLFCFFDGILQSTSYGYTGPFPPRVIGALSNGCGLSGVIIGICRAISLVVFPIKNEDKEDTNLFYGATLYFSLASFCCLICVVMFVIMSKTDYHKYYKLQHSWKNERSQKPSLDSQNQGILRNTIDTDMYVEHLENKTPSIFNIHNKMWKVIWGQILNYIITFAMFPGVLLQGGLSWINDDDWRAWAIIIIFTIFDTVGRVISGKYTVLTQNSAMILTFARLGLAASCLLSAKNISIFSSDPIKLANNILLALSLGFVGNCQMIIGCTQPESYERQVSSKMMNFCLVLGIFIGSLIASFGIVHMF